MMSKNSQSSRSSQEAGLILEEVNCLIEEWHEGAGDMDLHRHLGFTWKEYQRLVEGERVLPSLNVQWAMDSQVAYLSRLAESYYLRDDPDVSDARYDELVRCLKRYEDIFPLLINPNSVTQRPGGSIS
jgi:hypothetical protein